MKKKIMISVLVCLCVAVAAPALAKKKRVVKVMGGTPIPGFNLIIDASYDPEFDTFAPGYRLINVAIMNNSFNIIEMSPDKDLWWIKTKKENKKYKVIADLRGEDAVTWNTLSEKARNLISYPLLLPIGARQVIDLFVPEDIPAAEFREIIIYINSMGTTFEVLARQ